MSDRVEVERLPFCDFCTSEPVRRKAKYDGKTLTGPWANMCQEHFERYGIGLGTGKGQELHLRSEPNPDPRRESGVRRIP